MLIKYLIKYKILIINKLNFKYFNYITNSKIILYIIQIFNIKYTRVYSKYNSSIGLNLGNC